MTLENMTESSGLWEYNHAQTKASPPANCVDKRIGDGKKASSQTLSNSDLGVGQDSGL